MVSKLHSLLWMERLRESQRLTAREERRKEMVLNVFRELYDISSRRFDLPDFPPRKSHW